MKDIKISEEEKQKTRQFYRERYRYLSEDLKQRQGRYRRNYYIIYNK